MSDRLRKFFRIRGKTNFSLDEVVAPVVLVQDLTQGPYQAGVTPAAGQSRLVTTLDNQWSFAVLLNDKPGSLTPVLDKQFDGRSFSFTWFEMQNITLSPAAANNMILRLASRAAVVAAGVPTDARNLFAIQNNDGTLRVPVETFQFNSLAVGGTDIWRGILGDNTNTLGSRRTFDPTPNITIGPKDALVFATGEPMQNDGEVVQMNMRGFYQEQPS